MKQGCMEDGGWRRGYEGKGFVGKKRYVKKGKTNKDDIKKGTESNFFLYLYMTKTLQVTYWYDRDLSVNM